ncbi:MAG: hypothetical protein KatS3mg077_0945 [Candidatus Binatia bacterium]|nr:MAG: hypothetical protein KatS3mg077_0945 [Candidatus Binatia bacterium]
MGSSSDQWGEGLRDNFYVGRIVKLRPGSKAGVVESISTGRRIPFEWPLVRVIGADNYDSLRPGMEVGFDVSWTSKGLRVSVLKVFAAESEVLGGQDPGGPNPPSVENESNDKSL